MKNNRFQLIDLEYSTGVSSFTRCSVNFLTKKWKYESGKMDWENKRETLRATAQGRTDGATYHLEDFIPEEDFCKL